MKYLRLFREFFRACLVEEFEYRLNFFANIFSAMFDLLIAFITVKIYFYRTDTIGGWSMYEVLILLGVFNAVHGLISFFLQPNMSRLVNHIRKGTLDYVLTKPVDSQFYVSFRHLVFWKLADVLLGFGLIIYALYALNIMPSLTQFLIFIGMFISAMMIVYSLWMVMMTCSFWAVKVDNLSFLFLSFFETSRFPISVYRGVLKFLLMYIFPMAFITTFPSAVLINKLTLLEGLLTIIFAMISFVVSRFLWKFALGHYQSASS